jgi:hypothetical protein
MINKSLILIRIKTIETFYMKTIIYEEKILLVFGTLAYT